MGYHNALDPKNKSVEQPTKVCLPYELAPPNIFPVASFRQ